MLYTISHKNCEIRTLLLMTVGQTTSTPISFILIGRHLFHIRLESLVRGQAGLNFLNIPCICTSNFQRLPILIGWELIKCSDWLFTEFLQFWFGWWCMDRTLPVDTVIILVTVAIVRFWERFSIRLIWLCGWDCDFICTFIRDLNRFLGCFCEWNWCLSSEIMVFAYL